MLPTTASVGTTRVPVPERVLGGSPGVDVVPSTAEPTGFELGGSAGVGGRLAVDGLSGSIAEPVLGTNRVLVGDGPGIGGVRGTAGVVTGDGPGVGTGENAAPVTGVSTYGGS